MAFKSASDPLMEAINRYSPQNFGVVSSTSLADVGRYGEREAFYRTLPKLFEQRGQRQQQEALAQTQADIKQRSLQQPPVSDLLRMLIGGAGGAGAPGAQPGAAITPHPRVNIGSLGGGTGPIFGTNAGAFPQPGTGALPTAGGGTPGTGTAGTGGFDLAGFKSLLAEIMGPLQANLAPQEASARSRLEDAFRLAGGGAGPGSLQGPLLNLFAGKRRASPAKG